MGSKWTFVIIFDPKIDCKKCKTRFRADNFITDISKGKVNGDGMTYDEMKYYIEKTMLNALYVVLMILQK